MSDEKKVDVSNDSLFGTLKTKCENQFTDLSNFVGVYNTSKNDIAEEFVKLLTNDNTFPFILDICSMFSDTNRRVHKCEVTDLDQKRTYEFANIIREDYNIPISNVNSKRTFNYIDLRGRKNKNFSEYCTFDLSFDYPITKLCIRNALTKVKVIENMPYKCFILNRCVPYKEIEDSVVDIADEPTGNTRALLENLVTYFSLKYSCIVNFLASLESACRGDCNLADIRNIHFTFSKWYETNNTFVYDSFGGLVSTILMDLTSIINSRLPDGIGVDIKLVGKPDGKTKIDYSKERVGLHISLLVEKELLGDNSVSFLKMMDDYHTRVVLKDLEKRSRGVMINKKVAVEKDDESQTPWENFRNSIHQ